MNLKEVRMIKVIEDIMSAKLSLQEIYQRIEFSRSDE